MGLVADVAAFGIWNNTHLLLAHQVSPLPRMSSLTRQGGHFMLQQQMRSVSSPATELEAVREAVSVTGAFMQDASLEGAAQMYKARITPA